MDCIQKGLKVDLNPSDPPTILSVCPSLLSTGVCGDVSCVHSHATHACELCGMLFATERLYFFHTLSPQHKRKVNGHVPRLFQCRVCNKIMNGHGVWAQHSQSRRHRDLCAIHGVNPDVVPEEVDTYPRRTLCVTCNVQILDRSWDGHLRGKRHAAQASFAQFQTAIEDSERNKSGVSIVGDFDFDILDPAAASSGKTLTGSIGLITPSAQVELLTCTVASLKRGTSTPLVILSCLVFLDN